MKLAFLTEAKVKSPAKLDLQGFALPQGAELRVEVSLTKPENCQLWHDFGIPVINLYIVFRVMLDGKQISCRYLQF